MQERWLNTVSERIASQDLHRVPESDEELEAHLESLGLNDYQRDYVLDLLNDQELLGFDRGRASMGEEHFLARRRRLKAEWKTKTQRGTHGTA